MIFKERVECAMPARMMYAITQMRVFCFDQGREREGAEEIAKMRALLMRACMEPVVGLPRHTAIVLGKNIDRLHNQIMSEYENTRADKVATAVFYFLKELTDTGYLELYEGSPMADAAAMFVPMIEHVFETENLDTSSQKVARRILKSLQEKGYYV